MKYQVVSYDLWADGEGGLCVNEVYPQPYEVEIAENMTDAQIKGALTRAGWGAKYWTVRYWRGCAVDHGVDGGPGVIYFVDGRGDPAFELRS